jgi:PhnB protein
MVQAIPEGVSQVVAYLCIRGAAKAIEFYKAAFGAEVLSTMPMGDKGIAHAELRIGTGRFYLADEMPQWGAIKSPKTLKATTFNIHLWVEDCDAVFAQAVKAGGKSIMPLADQFWGDRYGLVQDPFGHVWAVSSHKEDVSPEEMERRGAEWMQQMAAQAPPAKSSAGKSKAKKASKAEKEKAKAAKKQAKAQKKAEKKEKKRKKKAKR